MLGCQVCLCKAHMLSLLVPQQPQRTTDSLEQVLKVTVVLRLSPVGRNSVFLWQ